MNDRGQSPERVLTCAIVYVLPRNVVARSSSTNHEYPFACIFFGVLELGRMDHLAFEFILQHHHHPIKHELKENRVERTFPGKSGIRGVTSSPNAKMTWTGRNTLSVAFGPVRRT